MKRGLAILVLALAPGCAKPHHARYASWEPTSPAIPTTPDRALARARLRQSRALFARLSTFPPLPFWETPQPPAYSYVRVEETSADELTITLLSVEGSRVVLRALVEVDPARIGRLDSGKPGDDAAHFTEVFIERGAEVGSHEGGAPPLTLQELYDQCEREVLGADIDAAPRLYFDPDGLLMQCGFAPGECDDCPTISIQSISTYPLTKVDPKLAVERWFCRGDQGPVLPGAFYAFALPRECQPPPPPPKALPSEELPNLTDVCVIDPKACPRSKEGGPRARFEESRPPVCPMQRERAPSLLDVGKLDPLATWSFPFRVGSGIECGHEGRTHWLRRFAPSLERSEW